MTNSEATQMSRQIRYERVNIYDIWISERVLSGGPLYEILNTPIYNGYVNNTSKYW